MDGLSEKLRSTLHLSAGERVDPTAPLIDQGVDSLNAITVASCQLFLDGPILKVLGGASIAELAEDAAGRLPPSAIPLVADAVGATVQGDNGTSPDVSESPDQSGSGVGTPIPAPTSTGRQTVTSPPQYSDFASGSDLISDTAGWTRTLRTGSPFRLSAVVAQRIKECARQFKAAPMRFCLAAHKTLLALLTGQGDLAIGIADTNRSSIDDISTMGFFQHAPHTVTLERPGLAGPGSPSARELAHAPQFQVVFDYRQGERADSGKIGGASIVKVMVSRERTPHDVVLEMADDPARDPLLAVELPGSLTVRGIHRQF
ncbi:hypothetical protein DL770_010177 [Monosporascus sp. CRB-9-2]|nr:hypothetical protein DL770_010177 [Monosporascus sp. CRB-9-2]